jgi:hypothetical protein
MKQLRPSLNEADYKIFREQAEKLGLTDYAFSKHLIQVGSVSYEIMFQIKGMVREQQKERLKEQKKHSPVLCM